MAIQNWNESFTITEVNSKPVVKSHEEFFVDTADDLANLDTDRLLMGSIAYVKSTGALVTLGSDGTWS